MFQKVFFQKEKKKLSPIRPVLPYVNRLLWFTIISLCINILENLSSRFMHNYLKRLGNENYITKTTNYIEWTIRVLRDEVFILPIFAVSCDLKYRPL